jgi:CubicO group peptidase (beta-lactamase class C family)
MSNEGWNSTRLARMRAVMSGYVDCDEVPGLVTLLHRHGQTELDVIGVQSLGGSQRMQRDTIFRITSMTKPITAVAALILVEECKLRLDEPVDRLLPELAERKVLARLDSELDDTQPAQRPISVRDLLTLRMGFGAIMAPPDRYPIQRAVSALKLVGMGPPDPSTPDTPDSWIHKLGTLPLIYQPGTTWQYNTAAYVLGVLIARASGQPLARFFQERIFEPLGMKDTAFYVPPEKLERLASSYMPHPRTQALELYDGVHDSRWSKPPSFPDAGAGLVSTADDCLAFGRMLLQRGKYGSARILSRLSVEAMSTDQLSAEQKARSDFFPGFWEARGWGFGVAIDTARIGLSTVPGRFGWDGGFGTTMYVDPHEDMVAMLMTQRAAPPQFSNVHLDFWTSVYQAIDD